MTPEERAKRLEAMLDDIHDDPASIPAPPDEVPVSEMAATAVSPELSSPDLESLDAGWGEDEEGEPEAAEAAASEAPAVEAGQHVETGHAQQAPAAPPVEP